MSEVKTPADWAAIELEYRAGVKSLEQIGKEFGVTKGRISQVAKRDKWSRDLAIRIKAKADARVNEAALNKGVNAKSDRLVERDVVEANAEVQYKVRMSHRTGLAKLCSVKDKLLEHVSAIADNFKDLAEVIAMIRDPDENGQDKANDRLKKMMDRSVVIDDLKKLSEIDEKVRKGEREAFGIDDGRVESPIDQLLLKIASER